MQPRKYIFTSESVTEGHPDKICDRISDSILDSFLKNDPDARVAVETMTTTGVVIVAGEVTSTHRMDVQEIVRNEINDIGYNKPEFGFDGNTCSVLVSLHEQSPDISVGITSNELREQGAGDQGLMFGFAINETPEFMPLPITLAHNLSLRLSQVRKKKELDWVRPDGKSQVSILYEDNKPKSIDTIVLSTQHSPEISQEQINEEITKFVINPVCSDWITSETKVFVNPTGRFVIGGPPGDTGLTGRKIIADTYGGMGRHGGGAFSGKDPTKVDRSACYMARYISKNIVAAELATKCEVQIAYAIGVAKPVSIMVDTFKTSRVDEEQIENKVKEIFDTSPAGIIRTLDLKKPIYKKTSAYGHFGRRDVDFSWEKTDKAEALQSIGVS
ncbi:MAG TPA: methionine adenosyltransferase [Candidatus Nitrosocosmicus sp.]|nr:methionine adenosyltransferase [Candidatus Nitrosocosmicus sp.]